MSHLQHVIGGPNDWGKRIEEGKCSLYSCSGRLLCVSYESWIAPVPEWINQEGAKYGDEPIKEIEVTNYKYRCLECGHKIESTKLFDLALMN
jgi:hypothetical protein